VPDTRERLTLKNAFILAAGYIFQLAAGVFLMPGLDLEQLTPSFDELTRVILL